MNVEEFVKNTLQQIVSGAKSASDDHFKFSLDSLTSKGVHFNLAVINTEKEEKGAKGKGGIGIKVVSAEYGKNSSTSASSETISRIEFNVIHRDLDQEAETRAKNAAFRNRNYN